MALNNNAAAKKFFECYYAKLSNHTKDLSKFREKYDAVLMSLMAKYTQEKTIATLKAALEDKFWLSKLFEPNSLERNFAKMKWELVDSKHNSLKELEKFGVRLDTSTNAQIA